MTTISERLESHVAVIRELKSRGQRSTPRSRAETDRHFAALMELLAPRIRLLTRRYGLQDMADDALQACAIGIHRAIGAYDPDKARFTTFVTWQLRGELQGLRHRVRLDQRDSAKSAGARTGSLDAPVGEGGETLVDSIVDPESHARAEGGAQALMAQRTAAMLFDDYAGHVRAMGYRKLDSAAPPGTPDAKAVAAIERQLGRERAVLSQFMLGEGATLDDAGMTSEQKRQVVRRLSRHMTARAATMPQFLALRPGARH